MEESSSRSRAKVPFANSGYVTFDRFVEIAWERGLRYATRLCRHKETAEDNLVEALVRHQRYWKNGESKHTSWAWGMLYRCIRTVTIDHFRKQSRRVVTTPLDDARLVAGRDSFTFPVETLCSLVLELPEPARTILQMLESGFTVKEVAERFEITPMAVKCRAFRARARLRERLTLLLTEPLPESENHHTP